MLEVMLARPGFSDFGCPHGYLLVRLPSVPGIVEEKCKSNKKLKNAHLTGLTGMLMLHGPAIRSSQPYCQNCRLRSAGTVPSIVFSGRMRALAHAGLPLVGAARLTAPSGLVPIG